MKLPKEHRKILLKLFIEKFKQIAINSDFPEILNYKCLLWISGYWINIHYYVSRDDVPTQPRYFKYYWLPERDTICQETKTEAYTKRLLEGLLILLNDNKQIFNFKLEEVHVIC